MGLARRTTVYEDLRDSFVIRKIVKKIRRPNSTLEKGLKLTLEHWKNKLAEGTMHE